MNSIKLLVLVLVLCLMAVLFLLGTAALNNTTTEYKTSFNYVQSVQAFNDSEAGIAEAFACINENLDLNLGQWNPATDNDLFN